MPVTSPEVLSAEQRLEKARNTLTSIEIDVQRYKKMVEAEKYTLEEMKKERIEMNEKIVDTQQTLNDLSTQVDSKRKSLEFLERDHETFQERLQEKENIWKKKESEYEKKRARFIE